MSTKKLSLPTFTFLIPFSSPKQACGPEARAWCAKSIGGKRNPLEGTPVFPQDGAGPSGVTQFGIRNVEFGIFTPFFHSAFRNRHSAFKLPALPKK